MFTLPRPALTFIVVFTLLLGLVYPLAMTGIAQIVFPYQANGSVIEQDGKVIGSALVGQSFSGQRYFHPRPSAVSYDAAGSGGSNLGPTSAALKKRIAADAGTLGASATHRVPVDLVTAPGSGLDPDNSPAAALYQIDRVAKARGLDRATVLSLVKLNTQSRTFDIFGESRVNVLALNLALDAADLNKPDTPQ